MESIENSEKERLQAEHFLACSPERDIGIFRVSLLKTFLPFLINQIK